MRKRDNEWWDGGWSIYWRSKAASGFARRTALSAARRYYHRFSAKIALSPSHLIDRVLIPVIIGPMTMTRHRSIFARWLEGPVMRWIVKSWPGCSYGTRNYGALGLAPSTDTTRFYATDTTLWKRLVSPFEVLSKLSLFTSRFFARWPRLSALLVSSIRISYSVLSV